GQVIDLPGRVIHARDALVGARHARLLEQAEVVIVRGARNLQERGGRMTSLDLEAHDVAVEPRTALDVRDPENQVLQLLEPRAGLRHAHREASWKSPTLRVRGRRAWSESGAAGRGPPWRRGRVTSRAGCARRPTGSW